MPTKRKRIVSGSGGHARPISRPKEAVIASRIKAFWVIASFGCDNIADIALLEYPAQFMVRYNE